MIDRMRGVPSLKAGANRGAGSDDCRRQSRRAVRSRLYLSQSCGTEAANDLYDEEATNPVFRRFYQRWAAFRYARYQWYRIAEASYSNFMAGQRLAFK